MTRSFKPKRFEDAVGFPFAFQDLRRQAALGIEEKLREMFPIVRDFDFFDRIARTMDPVLKQRKLLDHADANLRSVKMQILVLHTALERLGKSRAASEVKRNQILQKLNKDLSKKPSVRRMTPKLPPELILEIWNMRLNAGRSETAVVCPSGSFCRPLDDTVILEQRILGDAMHRARPLHVTIPVLPETHLKTLSKIKQAPLDVILSLESMADITSTDPRHHDLDFLLLYSSRWQRLTLHEFDSTELLYAQFLRCSAAFPYITHLCLWPNDGINELDGAAPIRFLEFPPPEKLRSAYISCDLITPFQQFLSNVTHLEVNLESIGDLWQFHNRLSDLPRSLHCLTLMGPTEGILDSSPAGGQFPTGAYPSFKKLVLSHFYGAGWAIALLRLFRGASLQHLVFRPSELEEEFPRTYKGLIKAIEEASSTLSVLAFTPDVIEGIYEHDLRKYYQLSEDLSSFTTEFTDTLCGAADPSGTPLLKQLKRLELPKGTQSQNLEIISALRARMDLSGSNSSDVSRIEIIVIHDQSRHGPKVLRDFVDALECIVPEVIVVDC